MKNWWEYMHRLASVPDVPMKPQVIAHELGKRLRDDAIVCCGSRVPPSRLLLALGWGTLYNRVAQPPLAVPDVAPASRRQGCGCPRRHALSTTSPAVY